MWCFTNTVTQTSCFEHHRAQSNLGSQTVPWCHIWGLFREKVHAWPSVLNDPEMRLVIKYHEISQRKALRLGNCASYPSLTFLPLNSSSVYNRYNIRHEKYDHLLCLWDQTKKKKIKYSWAIPVRIHHTALFFHADISTFSIIADIVTTLIRYHFNVLPCINYPLCLCTKVEYGFFLSYLFFF